VTPTDRARLDEIEERERKADKGPWSVQPSNSDAYSCFVESGTPGRDDERAIMSLCGKTQETHLQSWENGRFIASSRSDVPWLLALARRQESEIERLRAALIEIQTDHSIEPSEVARAALRGEEGSK